MSTKRNPDSEFVVSPSGSSAIPSRRKSSAPARPKHTSVPAEPLASAPEVPSSQAVAPKVAREPEQHEIAVLAYSYWESRGYQGGSPEEDWNRAVQELRSRATSTTA